MGLTRSARIHGRRPREKKRPAWVVGGVTILSFVVLLYIIEAVDSLSVIAWTTTASGRSRPMG